MSNINLHNVSKQEEALELAKKDLIAFGKLFLPDDYMRSETPPFLIYFSLFVLHKNLYFMDGYQLLLN